MLDLNALIKKLVKKLSVGANTFCITEKRGSSFFQLSVTQELCSLLHVDRDLIEQKDFAEILPLDLANKISKYYERAWNGEEVFYKLDFPHGNHDLLYKVITPVKYKGKVVRLVAYVVTVEQIPAELREVA